MRLTRRSGGIKKRLPKLFRARNIIIVSEQGVDHIPLSPRLQWLGCAMAIGFFCWISYMTGSYMAAESVIAEKDRKILAASLEKRRLGSEMLMMKRDLLKLNQTADAMTDYDKFIVQQYASDDASLDESKYQLNNTLFAAESSAAGGSDMMQQRLAFLEKQVAQLKEDNLNIVMAVYDKTKDKISDYEEIIAMTGLLPEKLLKQAATQVQRRQEKEQAALREAKGEKATDAGQGGPYVPFDIRGFDPEAFSPHEWEKGLNYLLVMQEVMDSIPLNTPIAGADVTSTFGTRIDPFRGRIARHTGVDLSGRDSAPIYAANDGVVTYAGYFAAYGNMVDIDHGLGMSTRYGHLRRFIVRPGQKVKQGQVIGYQGSTGRSTGQHLHYEVRYQDVPLNPMKFLRAGRYVVSQAHQ